MTIGNNDNTVRLPEISGRLVFGTYRLRGQVLDVALSQAIDYMTTSLGYRNVLIDTAVMYKNQASVLAALKAFPNAIVGSKVHRRHHVRNDIEAECTAYGGNLTRLLLHNYMPVEIWTHLAHAQAMHRQRYGTLLEIGVCNYTVDELRELIEYCTNHSLPRPTICQNELHPFVMSSVPEYCKHHGITFEAHSVMTALETYPSTWTANAQCTRPQIAIAYAFHRGMGNVVFNTCNYTHLVENTDVKPLNTRVFHEIIDTAALVPSIARYHGADTGLCSNGEFPPMKGDNSYDKAWIKECDEKYITDVVYPALKPEIVAYLTNTEDKRNDANRTLTHPHDNDDASHGNTPGGSNDIFSLPAIFSASHAARAMPKPKGDGSKVYDILASIVNSDDYMLSLLSSGNAKRIRKWSKWKQQCQDNLKYIEQDQGVDASKNAKQPLALQSPPGLDHVIANVVSSIRRAHEEAVNAYKNIVYPKSCALHAISNPEALPVVAPPAHELDDIINALSTTVGKTLPNVANRFQRGTLFADGRLDLCKQGMGMHEDKFISFCKAIETHATGVTDFLFGNNLTLRDDVDGKKLKSLTDLITNESVPIATWYLAGNAIDAMTAKPLANALMKSKHAKYVWLKMNPIKTGAAHMGQLLTGNPRIEVMDLFNCGLCDDGMKAFAQGMKTGSTDNDHGITHGLKDLYLNINNLTPACIDDIIATVCMSPQLESLYLGTNQLGDDALCTFLDCLGHNGVGMKLQRLEFGANGVSNEVLVHVMGCVTRLPHLWFLNMGSYKSAKFFKQSDNIFTDVDTMITIARGLIDNAARRNERNKCLLGLSNCLHSLDFDTDKLIDAVSANITLICGGNRRSGVVASPSDSNVYFHSDNMDMTFTRPANVENIQSIYRNIMA